MHLDVEGDARCDGRIILVMQLHGSKCCWTRSDLLESKTETKGRKVKQAKQARAHVLCSDLSGLLMRKEQWRSCEELLACLGRAACRCAVEVVWLL